jgi:HAD superfamily hydrolase (TIGR01509 family)
MKSTNCHVLIAGILSLLTLNIGAAHMIFDLGGVLFNTNKSAVTHKAGLLKLAFFALSTMSNPVQHFLLYWAKLTLIPKTEIIPCDETGQQLPEIMCDWLKGIPSKKILAKIEQKLTTAHPLWDLANAIFEPKSMAETQELIKEGTMFVQECIAQGHCVYILSNWDAESFTHIYMKYPEFFSLFSGIVISGDCGLLKPDPKIYQHLLLEYGLDASECFFIDNQPENIYGALQTGIAGSVLNLKKGKPDFDSVRCDLDTWINTTQQYLKQYKVNALF